MRVTMAANMASSPLHGWSATASSHRPQAARLVRGRDSVMATGVAQEHQDRPAEPQKPILLPELSIAARYEFLGAFLVRRQCYGTDCRPSGNQIQQKTAPAA